MADSQLPLTQQIEKLIIADQKKEAQTLINEQLRSSKPNEVIAALRAVTDPNVKPIIERWLVNIEARYAANPTSARLETQVMTAVKDDTAPPPTETKKDTQSTKAAKDDVRPPTETKKDTQSTKTAKDDTSPVPTKKDTQSTKAAKDDVRPPTETKKDTQSTKTAKDDTSPVPTKKDTQSTKAAKDDVRPPTESKKDTQSTKAAKDAARTPKETKSAKPPRPVPVFDDNDDLSWLVRADTAPRVLQKVSKGGGFLKTAVAAVSPRNGSSPGEQRRSTGETAKSETSVPSPGDRVKDMIEARKLPAFFMRYWPAVLWFVVGFVGSVILISVPFVKGGTTYPLYGIAYIPIAIFRHLRLNAFMKFNTRFFQRQVYVGSDYNTNYYQNRPDWFMNWAFNIVLTIFSVLYLYPFRETFNQAKFLIKAYREWGQGRNLEFRAAKWGRGWGR